MADELLSSFPSAAPAAGDQMLFAREEGSPPAWASKRADLAMVRAALACEKIARFNGAGPVANLDFPLSADFLAHRIVGWTRWSAVGAALGLLFSDDGGSSYGPAGDYEYGGRWTSLLGKSTTSIRADIAVLGETTSDDAFFLTGNGNTTPGCFIDLLITGARDSGSETCFDAMGTWQMQTAVEVGCAMGGFVCIERANDYARLIDVGGSSRNLVDYDFTHYGVRA